MLAHVMPSTPTTAVPCVPRNLLGSLRGEGAGGSGSGGRQAHSCRQWQGLASQALAGLLATPGAFRNWPPGFKPSSTTAQPHRLFTTHLPMITSAAMRPWRLAGPASGMRAGCPVTQSCRWDSTKAAGPGTRLGQYQNEPMPTSAPPPPLLPAHLDLHRVSHRIDVWVRGAHVVVHLDAAARPQLQPRALGQPHLGPHANHLQGRAGRTRVLRAKLAQRASCCAHQA